ncbi:endonuclease/exonuclease/phosphatase family protein [Cellulomonas sp. PhB143]|uniref:endonuclease/exonuclease/phosphatase family protein n=1 Tax=Cellulomonas sp. PhB143 TaxID=2485186 RepID=UPI000F479067|nr:endonuclease/exonuclease/phosphatase family protein [Cellulomonas sp. PhB143]ROS73407.1 endonuclease/exonuclease/phosphatase family protein [Cellulomonas sp. PhB143]
MRTRTSARLTAVTAATLCAGLFAAPALAGPHGDQHHGHDAADLRVATYNLSLNRATEGELRSDLSTRDDVQAQTVAEVIQRARPDVVLLNEFDYDAAHASVDLFRDNYLEVGQHGADPITYRYAYTAPSNTGVPSGFDLNNDGAVGGGDDAYGFGAFPGQYGMVVLSRYPIETTKVRTFQHFLWKDMPGALLPDDPTTSAPHDWFTTKELAAVRLSSKSHWDVPVQVGKDTVHVLASHPTPPSFDGPEDRNGHRNHDEIRFWSDYVTPGRTSSYIYDDAGQRGGLKGGSSFVVLGDMNSDPVDGDSYPGATAQLLDNRRIQDPRPTSAGAPEAARLQGGINLTQQGDPRYDTADFADTTPGNLRADYVLPSRDLRVQDTGVFWPAQSDPLSRLTGVYPFPSSDHRLVWLDVDLRHGGNGHRGR